MDLDVGAINILSQLSVTSNSVRDWEVRDWEVVERTIVGLLNKVINSMFYVLRLYYINYLITFQFYTKVVQ